MSGYGHDQLVNAAIIAKVAADRGLPARAQLIGIMTRAEDPGIAAVRAILTRALPETAK